MKSVITNVRTIPRNKKGEAINIVAIDLIDGRTVLRQLNQFKVDLENSSRLIGINLDLVQSVNHPAIKSELPAFRAGGVIEGDFKNVKAGDKYEDTNPESPDYGKMKEYTTDHVRVDGFLTLTPNPSYLQMELNANATARFMAQLSGAFSFAEGVSSKAASTADADEIPDELLDELAAGAGEETVEEVAETAEAPKAEKKAAKPE